MIYRDVLTSSFSDTYMNAGSLSNCTVLSMAALTRGKTLPGLSSQGELSMMAAGSPAPRGPARQTVTPLRRSNSSMEKVNVVNDSLDSFLNASGYDTPKENINQSLLGSPAPKALGSVRRPTRSSSVNGMASAVVGELDEERRLRLSAEQEVRDVRERMKALKDEIRRKSADLKAGQDALRTENTGLRSEMDRLRKEMDDRELTGYSQQKKNEQLGAALNHERLARTTAEEDLATVRLALQDARSELSAKTAAFDAVDKEAKDLRAELFKANADHQVVSDAREHLQAEVTSLRAKVKQHEADRNDEPEARAAPPEGEGYVSALKMKCSDLEKRLAESEQEAARLKGEVLGIRLDREELKTRLVDGVDASQRSPTGQQSRLQKRILVEREKVEALTAELRAESHNRKSLEDMERHQRQALAVVRGHLNSRDLQLKRLEETVATLRRMQVGMGADEFGDVVLEELAKLREGFAEQLDCACVDAEEARQALRSERHAIKMDRDVYLIKISALEARVARLESEHDEREQRRTSV